MKYRWLILVLAATCGLSAGNVKAQTTNSSNQQQYGSGGRTFKSCRSDC